MRGNDQAKINQAIKEEVVEKLRSQLGLSFTALKANLLNVMREIDNITAPRLADIKRQISNCDLPFDNTGDRYELAILTKQLSYELKQKKSEIILKRAIMGACSFQAVQRAYDDNAVYDIFCAATPEIRRPTTVADVANIVDITSSLGITSPAQLKAFQTALKVEVEELAKRKPYDNYLVEYLEKHTLMTSEVANTKEDVLKLAAIAQILYENKLLSKNGEIFKQVSRNKEAFEEIGKEQAVGFYNLLDEKFINKKGHTVSTTVVTPGFFSPASRRTVGGTPEIVEGDKEMQTIQSPPSPKK